MNRGRFNGKDTGYLVSYRKHKENRMVRVAHADGDPVSPGIRVR